MGFGRPGAGGPDASGGWERLVQVALDWSGRRHGAGAHIWRAEVRDGDLVALECGSGAGALAVLLAELAWQNPFMAVGLDFAFSFPAWFLASLGVESGPELWERAERCGETWLSDCPVPFWGRPARWRRPDLGGDTHFRLTDLAVPAVAGTRPKSPFQVGGVGSVGTGSIRGMPLLRRLREAGFAIWPFDPVGPSAWPRVVEIYPRLLTGPVAKSQEGARRAYVAALGWPAAGASAEQLVRSEDAFDAALAARGMALGAAALVHLPPVPPEGALEGWIWSPGPLPGIPVEMNAGFPH